MRKLKKIYIEITNCCNLSCSFCPKVKAEKRFIAEDEFKTIIEKIKDHTKSVYFHVKGEPLLHKGLFKFIDIASENGLICKITTNGTLIEENKEKLINSKVSHINISLHSFENNFDEYEEYLNKCIDFAKEINSKRKCVVVFRMWNLKKEIEKNESFIIDKISQSFNCYINYENKNIKISDNIYLSADEEFVWPDLKNDFVSDSGFCYGLRDQVAILVNGTVTPCCLDSEGVINLGNIFDNSFESILQSERAKKLYDGFTKRLCSEELCKRCGYRKRFD